MKNEEAKININDLIKKSGNSFHFEVVEHLKLKGWEVLISPYYTDNITEKPREIDIIAEKSFNVCGTFANQVLGTINIQLLIECKYVDATTLFWFDKIDTVKRNRKIIQIGALSTQGVSDKEALIKTFMSGHHYLKEEAAKLFYTDKKQNVEQDIIYKALNQCLNSAVYFRKGGSILTRHQPVHLISYPVILCKNNGHFYNANTKKLLKDDFLLEINYAYLDDERKSQEEYFLVDVVSFNNLDNFLKNLEETEVSQVTQQVFDKFDYRQRNQKVTNLDLYV